MRTLKEKFKELCKTRGIINIPAPLLCLIDAIKETNPETSESDDDLNRVFPGAYKLEEDSDDDAESTTAEAEGQTAPSIKKGDKVKVTSGEFEGKTGIVTTLQSNGEYRVDLEDDDDASYRVFGALELQAVTGE